MCEAVREAQDADEEATTASKDAESSDGSSKHVAALMDPKKLMKASRRLLRAPRWSTERAYTTATLSNFVVRARASPQAMGAPMPWPQIANVDRVLQRFERQLFRNAAPWLPQTKERPAPQVKHEFLVLMAVGDDSGDSSSSSSSSTYERNLLHMRPRLFDLCFVYSGNDQARFKRYKKHAAFAVWLPGNDSGNGGAMRFRLFYQALRKPLLVNNHSNMVLRRLRKAISSYRFVWLPDDAVRIDLSHLYMQFAVAQTFELSISQPAVLGHYTHAILAQQPRCVLRYTNYIATMAPLFSQSALQRALLPSLDLLSNDDDSDGKDLANVWANSMAFAGLAVVDFVEMCNMRQQQQQQQQQQHQQQHKERARFCEAGQTRVRHPRNGFVPSKFLHSM
jgi:hypothetical protein